VPFGIGWTTSFFEIHAAADERRTTNLVYFVFDLLFLDGKKVDGAAPS
jgi:ATP-dependent DNA ligase